MSWFYMHEQEFNLENLTSVLGVLQSQYCIAYTLITAMKISQVASALLRRK